MATDDLNGWATNPPSVLVKVQNTSRDAINGQLGVVVQWTNGRYLVHLASAGNTVSLKPENLVKANLLEQMQGHYQLLKNDPNIRRQAQNVYQKIQALLPAFMKPEYLLIPLLSGLAAMFYFLGFSKTLMILSFVMLVLIVIGPDLFEGANVQQVVRNAPMRFRNVVRQHVPMGEKIASNSLMTAALAGLVIFLFVNALWTRSPTTTTTASSSYAAPVVPPMVPAAASRATLEHYYLLGFDDGKTFKPYGTSLPPEEETVVKPGGVTVEDDWPMNDDMTNVPSPRQPWYTKLGNITVTISVGYVFRTLWELGRDPASNNSWSLRRAMANFATLDSMKLSMLGMSLYRIVQVLFLSK